MKHGTIFVLILMLLADATPVFAQRECQTARTTSASGAQQGSTTRSFFRDCKRLFQEQIPGTTKEKSPTHQSIETRGKAAKSGKCE